MSALLPFVLLAVANPAQAPATLPLDKIPPTRKIQELMLNTLESPSVQTKLGVTDVQRSLMALRLSQNTLRFGIDLARETHRDQDDPNTNPMGLALKNSSGRALYPFLAEAQLAKLRRLTLKSDPLGTLETDEVAFALGLTNAQRKSLDAIRLRLLRSQMDPAKPAVKEMVAAFGEVAKLGDGNEGDASDDAAIIARLDRMEKAVDRLYARLERAVRLDATTKHAKDPDGLAVLTPAQRRRFRDLSSGTLALDKPRALVAKRG